MLERKATQDVDFVPVVEASNLDTLECVLGHARFNLAIEKFKDDLALRTGAIADGNIGAREKGAHAHKLVGTAGIMGLTQLAEASRRLEHAIEQDADLQLYVDAVIDAADRARAALETYAASR